MADIINRWNVNGVYYQIHDYGRGIPGGVATLDDEGRIPYQQLPLSTITYKGAWEADINVPDLTALTEVVKGDMYVVISSGRQDLGMFKYTAISNPAGYNPQAQGWYEYDGTDYIATTDTVAQIGKVYYSRAPMGSVMFLVGDRVIWDGQQWERVPAGGVTSVNGKSGDVVLTGNDVALSPDTATSVADTIKGMDYSSSGVTGDFISNIVQTDGKITSVTKGSIPAGPSVSDSAVAGQYVSAVSQSNGKISVSRGTLPAVRTYHFVSERYAGSEALALALPANTVQVRVHYDRTEDVPTPYIYINSKITTERVYPSMTGQGEVDIKFPILNIVLAEGDTATLHLDIQGGSYRSWEVEVVRLASD